MPKLTPIQIRLIENITDKGDRVEIVPVRDGKVKILRVRRNEVKVSDTQK